MTAPYRYHTLDGDRFGASYARGRARQDAARIARETGQVVELVDPRLGTWHISRATPKRAQWRKVADAPVSHLLDAAGIAVSGYSVGEVAALLGMGSAG